MLVRLTVWMSGVASVDESTELPEAEAAHIYSMVPEEKGRVRSIQELGGDSILVCLVELSMYQ